MFSIENMRRWFSESLNVDGRITRTDHLMRKLFLVFLLIFVGIIVLAIIGFFAKMLGVPVQMGASKLTDLFFVVGFLIYAYIFGVLWNVVTVLRLHDMDWDGRWCVLNFAIFIPMFLGLFRINIPRPGEFPLSYTLPVVIFVLFNLVVLVVKGDDKANKYGLVPWDPANHVPTEQEKLMKDTKNPYIAAYGANNRRSKPKMEPGHGIARKVDKKIIKHNDRYQPKSAKRK